MDTVTSDVFRKSGRAWFGMILMGFYGILMVMISLVMTLDILLGNVSLGGITFCLIFWGFASFFLNGTYKASRLKTIEIDETSIRYSVGKELVTEIPYQDIKELRTYSVSGKAPARGFMIYGEEGSLLNLNSRDDISVDILKPSFQILYQYTRAFEFEVHDPLTWKDEPLQHIVRPPPVYTTEYKSISIPDGVLLVNYEPNQTPHSAG